MTTERDEPIIVTFIGPTAAPPSFAIEAAESVAAESPCQKRKVGISIYVSAWSLPGGREVVEPGAIASGFNGPPDPGVCDGSTLCRRDCAKRCVHAETRAIAEVDTVHPEYLYEPHRVRLVHVKLDDSGKIMPCDGPSCVDCSKIILDRGLGGIWLYELGEFVPPTRPEMFSRMPPRWVYYPAAEFHRVTCQRTGVYQPGQP